MPDEWSGITHARAGGGLCLFHYDGSARHYWRVDAKVHRTPKAGHYCTLDRPPHVVLCDRLHPADLAAERHRKFPFAPVGFHAAEGHSQVHSPEELDMLFTESHEGGEINRTEFEILHRVVRFSDTTARAVMVPRLEMQALPVAITRSALTDFLQDRPHTRIPVYQDSLDEIIGIVNSKDLEHLNNRELSQELEQLKTAISGKNNGQRTIIGWQPGHG